MKRSLSLLALASGAALWLACDPAGRAANVLSNLGQETDGTEAIDFGQNGWTGQSFVTSSSDLNLNSVTLEFSDFNISSEGTEVISPDAVVNNGGLYPLVVSIYNTFFNGLSVTPGSDLIDLTAGNNFPTSFGSYVYTAPGGFTLDPNTEYWIVASTQTFATFGSYEWDWTDSTSVDNPDAANVDATSLWALDVFDTYSISTDQGGSWITNGGFPQQFEISASPVPEPGTWALLAIGAPVLLGFAGAARRRAV